MVQKTFEAGSLPDSEKEALCRALLAEFGVSTVKTTSKGELIHQCVLPLGGHTDHDSVTASLNYKKLVYHCFVCGNSGGLLWFIGVCRGTSGIEARKWLEKQADFSGTDENSLANLLTFFDQVYDPKRSIPQPLPKMDTRILVPWLKIHPYLTEVRGIPEPSIMRFMVGWNEQTNRIVIPHFWRGHLVGWQTRRLSDDGTPKYQSSPDFPKDRTLFHYDPKKRPVAVVVESPMSVLSKYHLGHSMVATFGASVTDRQVRLLADHRRVILFFDNDRAGWAAIVNVGQALEAYTDVWVVENAWAADAADLDDATFLDLVQEAVPFAVWRLPDELKEWGDEKVQSR